MHHGRVVFAAELPSDFGQRGFGHLLGQIHRDLARHNDSARVVLLLQLGDPHAELLGYRALDGLNGDLANLRVDELFEALLRGGQRDLDSVQTRPGKETRERAFELAHIRADIRGDEERDIGRDE